MPRRPLLAATVAAAALAAAGCGAAGSSTSTATGAASTAPATTSSPTAGGADRFASGPVPAVGHATDLKVEPTIHAGSGAAPTQLVGADLVKGTGPTATAGSTVKIQYVGALYSSGKVFDSSWSRGQPASFPLSQVIPGFAQGIVGMKVGGRREVVIPPALGYGSQANGPIPANSTLVFVIDLLGVS